MHLFHYQFATKKLVVLLVTFESISDFKKSSKNIFQLDSIGGALVLSVKNV